MQRSCLLFAELAVFVMIFAQAASAALTNRYVIKANATAAEPYDTPANAAGDIQAAINYANIGETVLVYAATYDTGGVTNWPAGYAQILTNRVAITKAITVQSLNNDPANTIIKGAWASNGKTNGADAVRCVYMANGSKLVGFTLTNGATITTNDRSAGIWYDMSGGGILSISARGATISNCVITMCSAFGDRINGYSGGGSYHGSFFNCTFIGNSTPYNGGGAAQSALLSNCTVVGNSAPNGGGVGVYNDGPSILYGCIISNNSAENGGGVYNSGSFVNGPTTLYGCTLANNRASTDGGGAYRSYLYGCTLVTVTCRRLLK